MVLGQHGLREDDVVRGHDTGIGLRPLHGGLAGSAGRCGDHVGAGGQRGRGRVLGVVVARAHTTLTVAAALITDVDTVVVRRIGIDEHRFRRVRYFRSPTGVWRRHERWMSTIVDLDTGRVLGVVDGRDNKGVSTWLAARPAAWRDPIEVMAIDPSAAFAKAVRTNLPAAAIHFDDQTA